MPSVSITPSKAPPNRPVQPRRQSDQDSWPVRLYDQVVLQSSGSQAFQSQNFTNNLDVPIELRELVVNLTNGAGASATVVGGGLVALDLAVGSVKITRGPILVWGLCRSINRTSEKFTNGVVEYAWRFPYPVILMPGQKLDAQATHQGVIPQSVTVSLSFGGRAISTRALSRVPYVAAWTSRSFSYSEAGVDSSPAAALVNDTGTDFHVYRVIGRSMAYGGISGSFTELLDFSDASLQAVNAMSVRMNLSQNRPILKFYSPWRTVFGQSCAIETDFIMRPGDFITADVQHVAGPTLPSPLTFSQTRGMVSLIGWREV